MVRCLIFSLVLTLALLAQDSPSQPPLRVLIVTGGHDFEEDAFWKMFATMRDITWKHARFRQGAESLLSAENAASYDVAVFYDMHQDKDPHWQSWLEVLKRGKPTVFLHHALGSYIHWDEYGKIVGGHANFSKAVVPGIRNATYQHDVAFRVHIADPHHPITTGLKDFDIVDEIYDNYQVNNDVHILLTTDHPGSARVIAWTHTYGRSPIVYLQLGHDHTAYENPTYGTVLERAILWVAGRLQ